MDPVRAIADAVLYEGYVLWPYRRSALKNQRRWTFGGVYPAGHSAGHEDDPCVMRTACLLEGGDDAQLDVRVRFLHVVRRRAAADGPHGRRFVDELVVGGARHLAWEEAVEREVGAGALGVAELAAGRRVVVDIAAGEREEPLREPDGRVAGALVRSW
jgi:hypothetical protein